MEGLNRNCLNILSMEMDIDLISMEVLGTHTHTHNTDHKGVIFYISCN